MSELQRETFERVHLIYNPQAGNRLVQRNVGTVASRLSEIFSESKVSIEPTSGPSDATVYARRAAEEYGDQVLVVVAGGDGSISEAANGLIGSDATLLPLPFGSGNDLARALYKTNSPHGILSAFLSQGAWKTPMDALRVSGSDVRDNRGNRFSEFSYYSINLISIGLDSKVAITADRIQRKVPWTLGMSYPLGIVKALTEERTWRMKITLDDASESAVRDYLICAVGNARYYGGGFLPHPDALVNDGLMNILTARPLSISKIAQLLGKFRAGERIEESVATYETASRATLEALGRELVLTLDGEGFYAGKVDVETVPAALNVALPISWGIPSAFAQA
ncbi:MAG: diacylglycerol kinase family protein [Actinomycetaceae bacterium]|nr:diacylglycerol kinase family protein [Actinomycetaceae bacterium]